MSMRSIQSFGVGVLLLALLAGGLHFGGAFTYPALKRDAAYSDDMIAPVVVVTQPSSLEFSSESAEVLIRGTVTETDLHSLTANGFPVPVINGAFVHSVGLFKGLQLRVVLSATDRMDNRSIPVTVTLYRMHDFQLAGSRTAVIGTWTLDVDYVKAEFARSFDRLIADMPIAQRERFAAMRDKQMDEIDNFSLILRFKSDGTYTRESSSPKTQSRATCTGVWKSAGGQRYILREPRTRDAEPTSGAINALGVDSILKCYTGRFDKGSCMPSSSDAHGLRFGCGASSASG